MDPCGDFNPLDLGDQESGIDLAYDMSVILSGTLDDQDLFGQTEATKDASLVTPPSSLNGNYYQLKSKPVNESDSSSFSHSRSDYFFDNNGNDQESNKNGCEYNPCFPHTDHRLELNEHGETTTSGTGTTTTEVLQPQTMATAIQNCSTNAFGGAGGDMVHESLHYGSSNSSPFLPSHVPTTASPGQTPHNYKGMPRSRTNFKQELMREQTVQEEKRQAQLKNQQQARQLIQSASVPFQQPPLNNVDVPAQVLQVRTRLENPTFYYLKYSQQRQVRQYLNHSVAGSVPQSPVSSPLTTNRPVDARNGVSALSSPHLQQRLQLNGPFAVSAPPTLLNSTPSGTSSPAPQSSLATSLNSVGSEGAVEHLDPTQADLVEDILSLEADRPNASSSSIVDATKFYSPTTKGVSDPAFAVLNFGLESQDSPSLLDGSNPVSPIDDQVRQAQAKDRQKKDNHNMIERRRRFNINDRIKELGTLLPRSQDEPYFEQVGEFRPNKGTILKASVDYIKLLKSDSDKVKPLEAELRRSELEIRRQNLRIQELEKLLKMSGIHISDSTDSPWNSPHDSPSDGIKSEVTVKKEPDLINHCDGVEGILVLDDLMEDDTTVVTGSVDPILTQTLDPLDEMHSQQLHDRMDYF